MSSTVGRFLRNRPAEEVVLDATNNRSNTKRFGVITGKTGFGEIGLQREQFMNKPPMEGIYTPNITPVDAKGRVDEDTLCAYVDWLIDRGVHGLYPNGSTGEFTRFTAQERRRIIEVLMKHVNGRVPILAGAAEANVRETIDACEAYGAMGVRAVAIVAPFYYKLARKRSFSTSRKSVITSRSM